MALCWFGHRWLAVGPGYEHGGGATFRPYRCERCQKERLRTEWDNEPLKIAATLIALVAGFGLLSLVLYFNADDLARVFERFIPAWLR